MENSIHGGWSGKVMRAGLVALLVFAGYALAHPQMTGARLVAFPATKNLPSETDIVDPSDQVEYHVTLVADRDIKNRLVAVDMILHRKNAAANARNLIEQKGIWHGMEPFSIVAADLKGEKPSVFGSLRKIPIQDSYSFLRIDIRQVRVTGCTNDANCALSSVKVKIEILH